jgi:hypothetical protein
MSHIDINANNASIYWILQNLINSQYMSGITDIGQITEASDDWSLYFSTTNREHWETQCLALNIPYELENSV